MPILQSGARIDLLISDVDCLASTAANWPKLPDAPGLRVLFITGYTAMVASRSEFLEPGMDMITKPFAMDDLATNIRNMLASG
ncbi:MAG: hypothetical protein JWQ65_2814 [Devosia sp.]|nr:hypothetical protein [Devosia sp.]